jgi:hypothetical protein
MLFNAGQGLTQPAFMLTNDSELLWGLHDRLRPILHGCFDDSVSDEKFEESLSRFRQRLSDLRQLTLSRRKRNGPKPILRFDNLSPEDAKRLAEMNGQPTQEAEQDPQSTAGYQSHQQPLPELPGESDES